MKEEERQMGPERGREKGRERHRELKKKEAASERQQCQQRGTVVFGACCRLACHQLAWGRCNRECLVIIAVNLPQSTCAFHSLIFTKIQRGQSGFQHFTPIKTKDKSRKRTAACIVNQNWGSCVYFFREKKHISDDNFCCLSLLKKKKNLSINISPNIPLFSTSTVVSYRV